MFCSGMKIVKFYFTYFLQFDGFFMNSYMFFSDLYMLIICNYKLCPSNKTNLISLYRKVINKKVEAVPVSTANRLRTTLN